VEGHTIGTEKGGPVEYQKKNEQHAREHKGSKNASFFRKGQGTDLSSDNNKTAGERGE